MKSSSKIAFAAAALIAAGALGTVAYAHGERGGHGGYHGGGHGSYHGGGYGKHGGYGRHGGQRMRQGRRGGRGMRNRLRHMIERYDANDDKKVTQEEINSNREAWLKEFDADSNGQLSLDEFKQLFLKARAHRIVREFQRFDRDGSAGLSLEEYQRPLAEIVERRDRNGDDALSREDLRGKGMRGKGMRGGRRMMRGGDDGRMDSESNQQEEAPAEGGSAN